MHMYLGIKNPGLSSVHGYLRNCGILGWLVSSIRDILGERIKSIVRNTGLKFWSTEEMMAICPESKDLNHKKEWWLLAVKKESHVGYPSRRGLKLSNTVFVQKIKFVINRVEH